MKTEEFATHATWTVAADLKAQLEGDLHSATDEDRYSIQRLHAVAELLDAIREGDPVLVEPQVLNQVHQHLIAVSNSLAVYLKDPDAQRQYLNNASAQVASVIEAVRPFGPLAVPDEAQRSAKAASTRYRNSLDAEVQRLQSEVDALQQQLVEAQEQRDAARTAAEAGVQELSTTITARGSEIDGLVTRLQSQIDQQRTAFEEESAARNKSFAAGTTERDEAEQERVKALGEAAVEQQAEQERSAQAAIDRLVGYESQAATLVDTTSRHAITGDYQTWAAHQAKAAFGWTVAAVVIGLATVGGLVYALGSATDDSLQFTFYKTSISVVGLIIAGYAARQAGEHRKEERAAKRMALDLAALEPFLDQLEDTSGLREEIARRVFVPDRGREGDTEIRTRRGALSIRELSELVALVRGGPPGA